jgi:hypothetical protein
LTVWMVSQLANLDCWAARSPWRTWQRPQALAFGERLPEAPATNGTAAPDGLTVRELVVLRLVASGRSNGEIAEELILSVLSSARHGRRGTVAWLRGQVGGNHSGACPRTCVGIQTHRIAAMPKTRSSVTDQQLVVRRIDASIPTPLLEPSLSSLDLLELWWPSTWPCDRGAKAGTVCSVAATASTWRRDGA